MKTRLENLAETLEGIVLETLHHAKRAADLSPREREALFLTVNVAIGRLQSARHMLQDSGDDCA
jgi:hypothetical protein